MRGQLSRIMVTAAAVLLLTACGGGAEEEPPPQDLESEVAELMEDVDPSEVPPPSIEAPPTTETPPTTQAPPTTEAPATEPPTAAPAPDGGSGAGPCEVVTAADVEQVLGEPVEEQTVPGLESAMCTYQTTGDITSRTEIGITVERALPLDQLIDLNTSFLADATTQPVDGLGERAVGVITESQGLAFLFVRVADTNLLFTLINLSMSPAEALEIETQVARIAVERLS